MIPEFEVNGSLGHIVYRTHTHRFIDPSEIRKPPGTEKAVLTTDSWHVRTICNAGRLGKMDTRGRPSGKIDTAAMTPIAAYKRNIKQRVESTSKGKFVPVLN
jgi:hypothetical protein